MVVYIGLGKISGTEVIAQLQRNHPEVPVIITGYSLPNTVFATTWLYLFPGLDSADETGRFEESLRLFQKQNFPQVAR